MNHSFIPSCNGHLEATPKTDSYAGQERMIRLSELTNEKIGESEQPNCLAGVHKVGMCGIPSVPASGLGRVEPLVQKKPSQHCPPASVAFTLGQNLPPSHAWHSARLFNPGSKP